jgi:hypothetical protein
MEPLSFMTRKDGFAQKSADEAHFEERAPPALGEAWEFSRQIAGVQKLAESQETPEAQTVVTK